MHTNRIENFWSLLKRALKGTYISVEPFHLFRILDEQAFRFNNRKTDDGDRFGPYAGHRRKAADLQKADRQDRLAIRQRLGDRQWRAIAVHGRRKSVKWTMSNDSQPNSDSPFPRFERVMKAFVQVPKKEVEERAAQERRKRRARKRTA